MRGRDVFLESLRLHDAKRIFGNPGTTESPLLDHLADYPDIEYVVALYEAVAVGAASFYAQSSGKTAVANLHVAPGLGNAAGMMYSAMRANAPVIITAGQQDTRMRLQGPVLGHDLVSIAAPVTKWAVQVETADEMADVMRRAFKVANEAPKGPVFIALPINVMEQETENAAVTSGPLHQAPTGDMAALASIAAALSAAKSPAIVAGDDVARAGANGELLQLAEKLGANVWTEGMHAQAIADTRHPLMRGGLPFEAGPIKAMLGDADCVLLIGGPFFEPVWYEPGSPFPDGASVFQIEQSSQMLARNYTLNSGVISAPKQALAALLEKAQPDASAAKARVDALAAAQADAREAQKARTARAAGRRPMPMSVAMAALAEALPDNVVMVEEAITASTDFSRSIDFAGPGDYYAGRGGAIGQGLAGAIGVSVANPDRPVVCVSGDGSAMYSIQALWTAAHHNLNLVFVILSNREYRILKHNIDVYRSRFDAESNRGYTHMDLTGPDFGFVQMAAGMGVPGEQVSEPEEFTAALARAIATDGPALIDVVIEGKAK